jgi:hypothetical protein
LAASGPLARAPSTTSPPLQLDWLIPASKTLGVECRLTEIFRRSFYNWLSYGKTIFKILEILLRVCSECDERVAFVVVVFASCWHHRRRARRVAMMDNPVQIFGVPGSERRRVTMR